MTQSIVVETHTLVVTKLNFILNAYDPICSEIVKINTTNQFVGNANGIKCVATLATG